MADQIVRVRLERAANELAAARHLVVGSETRSYVDAVCELIAYFCDDTPNGAEDHALPQPMALHTIERNLNELATETSGEAAVALREAHDNVLAARELLQRQASADRRQITR